MQDLTPMVFTAATITRMRKRQWNPEAAEGA